MDTPLQPPDAGDRRDLDGACAASGSTSCASSWRTSGAASATRSACIHSTSSSACSRELGRPVRWTEWRTDQHTANAHGNERTFLDVEVAVQADETMTGFGCARSTTAAPSALRAARLHYLGPGHARLLHVEEHPRRLPAGLHEQVAGVAEPRLLTDAAPLADRADRRHRGRGLGLDPVDVRKRNYVKAEEMPYETLNGCVYDSGDYRGARPRARPDRPRHDRGARRRRLAASSSASASAPLSTRARATSASRSCSTRSCSSPATTRRPRSSWTSSARWS